MDFITRLEKTISENNTTQKELAEKVGIRRPTISEWKKNGAIPAGDICYRIAKYLNVSMEWLITGHEDEEITMQERDLLSRYNDLSFEQRETINMMIDGFTAKNREDFKKEKFIS